MAKKGLSVYEYANHFGLVILSGFQSIKTRLITQIPTVRPGFELCGYFKSTVRRRIVLLGNKELDYIRSSESNPETLLKAYQYLTNDECPCIVICRNLECPKELLEIAKAKDFPILLTSMATSQLNVSSYAYLQEKLAPTKSLHASLLEIYSTGVLIIGESGIGKSETTLELIKKGHKLVSDDRVNITFVRGELIGEAPELIQGMMEVRGIGIIDASKIFGINSLIKKKEISYVINLVHYDRETPYDRLGNSLKYYEILGKNVPMLDLPVSGARSMADIIEVAVTNLKLKEEGFDSTFEFENRMNELLSRKKN